MRNGSSVLVSIPFPRLKMVGVLKEPVDQLGNLHSSEEDREDRESRRAELERSEVLKSGRVILRTLERGEIGE